MIFSNLSSNCYNLWDRRNLQEQVKKAFCYQKLFWPFTVRINCSSELKMFSNSWPSASNFKRLSGTLEQFFLTVGQNNFDDKIPVFFQPLVFHPEHNENILCLYFFGSFVNFNGCWIWNRYAFLFCMGAAHHMGFKFPIS